MNVAILYDSAVNAEIEIGKLLSGEPLYIHSLKRFYLHPDIDYIIMLWKQDKPDLQEMDYIDKWENEYGIRKTLWNIHGNVGLPDIFAGLLQREKRKAELYVFHDIRYPLVTSDMIYIAAQKASMHGIAVTSCGLDENLVFEIGGGKIDIDSLRYIKCPIAARADNKLLKETECMDELLKNVSSYEPYLCNTKDKNPMIYSWEDMKMAEAILKIRQEEYAAASFG